MYEKRCSRCGGFSYSASIYGGWSCPYCGKDLTMSPAKPAGRGPSRQDIAVSPETGPNQFGKNVIVFPKNKR